ncbi:phosphotransferase [Nonomuraea monospora]|uniref:phosphotransferase n=1 Tax=Nonomuraea monospora TaxID=568818 RepID=UPI0031D0E2EC
MINVVEWTRLEPWRVARVRTDGGETVIVKWSGPHAARTHSEEWRLRTEVAALRFLAEDLGVRVAPRVLTTSHIPAEKLKARATSFVPAAELEASAVLAEGLGAGHVVLEDLAPRTPLDGLLRRDGAEAHAARLTAFAHARGELGAITAGHASLYYRRRSTLGPVDPTADLLGHVGRLRASGTPQTDALEVPARGGVARELEAALDELADPGPFLVFSNGDPDTNNVLVRESGPPDPRLIDFEFAGYRHALHDAAYLHVPGPAWMWAALPDSGDVYRRALAAGVPEAEDERRYGRGLVAACVAYALSRLTRLPVLDARPAGDDSRAQLVATMEATARTADTRRALPHLAGWCRHLAAALRRRWPDADIDVATLSPYTPRGR